TVALRVARAAVLVAVERRAVGVDVAGIADVVRVALVLVAIERIAVRVDVALGAVPVADADGGGPGAAGARRVAIDARILVAIRPVVRRVLGLLATLLVTRDVGRLARVHARDDVEARALVERRLVRAGVVMIAEAAGVVLLRPRRRGGARRPRAARASRCAA